MLLCGLPISTTVYSFDQIIRTKIEINRALY